MPLILIVDDEENIRQSLVDILRDEGYQTMSAESGEDALNQIKDNPPDAVFLDIWLPGMDGLKTLEKIKEISDSSVIMISGHGNIDTAVRATKLGAYDFLEKPLSLDRVLLTVHRALERKALENDYKKLKNNILKDLRLVGQSKAIKSLLEQVELSAKAKGRVLITGESGTGKEIVARLIHENSDRAMMPFVELNCAAIPTELIESELFGHEKGSFTGAFEQKKGKFEMSDRGTLFLDEVADMSVQTQAKLLRVLETQQFQRVGGSKNIKVDVRVIAATNKNLQDMIKKELFRDDLYFRLNVMQIHIPPLRERKEDIPLLIEYFLGKIADEYGQPKKRINPHAIEKLTSYDWPGNIRELRNMLERLIIMCQGQEITEKHIDSGIEQDSASEYSQHTTLKSARDAFEKDFISKKLRQHDWNISKTAEALQIERSNLHKKIRFYDIKIS